MIACNCRGISGGTYHCRVRTEAGGDVDCNCWDECCWTGRLADDGDGIIDFMPEEGNCACKEPE